MVAKVAAVTAVALPLVGFVTRAIAFALCGRIGSPGTSHIAAAASLSDLAVAGMGPVIFAVPIYIAAIANVWEGPKKRIRIGPPRFLVKKGSTEPPKPPRGWAAFVLIVLLVVALAVFLALMLITPLFLAIEIVGVVALSSWLRLIYGRRHSFRVMWTWPILVTCLVLGSIINSVQFSEVPHGDYTLDPSTGVPSGSYLELGRTGDTVYLLSCTDTKAEVVGVAPASIERVEYRKESLEPRFSLLDLLKGTAAAPLGLQTQCP
jgi:hypothetical protein